jgi:hypothetical protein
MLDTRKDGKNIITILIIITSRCPAVMDRFAGGGAHSRV